jgi:DNA mismatch repair protein MutL
VGFVLRSGERTVLEVEPADTLRQRVAALWGSDEADTLIALHLPLGGMSVDGLVQRPDAAQTGLRRVQLFVNGRPFRDRALVQAAERGYRTTIAPGVRPWMFLHLSVPGDFVDVNVHPMKAEVRFRHRQAVEELLESAVRSVMADRESSAPLGRSGPSMVRESAGSGWATPGAGGASGAGGPPSSGARRRPEPDPQTALFVSAAEPGADPIRDPDAGAAASSTGVEPSGEAATASPAILPVARPTLHQIHRTWMLAESRDGLLIIDQHSAHERVLFERLMNAYAEGGADAQRLLFPMTVKLTPDELREIEDVRGLLARAGFEVEPFGSDTVIVHTVPNPHPWFDAERCFREMVAELTAGTSDLMRAARNQHERIAMTFACKGAIKAGQVMTQPEMQELFEALFATELPWHDVHGRPTVVRLSVAELERKFGR